MFISIFKIALFCICGIALHSKSTWTCLQAFFAVTEPKILKYSVSTLKYNLHLQMKLRIQSSCGKNVVYWLIAIPAVCNSYCISEISLICLKKFHFHLLKSFARCDRQFMIHCMFKACYVFWFFFQVKQFFLCTSPTYLLNYFVKKAVETCPVQFYSDGSFNQVPL